MTHCNGDNYGAACGNYTWHKAHEFDGPQLPPTIKTGAELGSGHIFCLENDLRAVYVVSVSEAVRTVREACDSVLATYDDTDPDALEAIKLQVQAHFTDLIAPDTGEQA